MVDDLGALLADLQHIARMEHHDVFLGDPQGFCQFLLGHPVAEFTMDGDGIFGMHQGIDQLDLLLAGMARYMGILGDHLRSLHGKLVDDPCHCLFISRNGRGA